MRTAVAILRRTVVLLGRTVVLLRRPVVLLRATVVLLRRTVVLLRRTVVLLRRPVVVLLPRVGGQRAVLLPSLPNLLALVRRQAAERLVLLARRAPLVRRELRPRSHLLLDALLLRRPHAGIALGESAPFLLALRLEAVPVRSERREDLLLLRRELMPALRGRRPGRA